MKIHEDAPMKSQIDSNNAAWIAGYSADDITNAFMKAVRDELAANQQQGLPVARYDVISRQAYLEYVDGTSEYINE